MEFIFNKQYARKTATMIGIAGAALAYSGAKSDLADALIADQSFQSARTLTKQAFTLESVAKNEVNERKSKTDMEAESYQFGLGDRVKATLDKVDELHRQAYAIMPAKKFAEKTDAYIGARTMSALGTLLAAGASALAAFNGYRTLRRKENSYDRR